MPRNTASLAGSESARGQSPSSSAARGAMSDNTPAASRQENPKPSATGRHILHPPRATIFLVEDSEKADHELDTPFSGWEEEKDEVRRRRNVIPARTLRTPCPFSDLSTFGELVSFPITSARHRSSSLRLPTGRLLCAHISVWYYTFVWSTAPARRIPLLKRRTRFLDHQAST
ncbi:hypothetical protein Plhal710r2_c030g0113291 [Plasmopara halstedii]